MSREDYLRLAEQGLKMPIGADLVLRELANPEAILIDGKKLGDVVISAARRYRTPLAMPVMDLTVEKAAMLRALDVPTANADAFQFATCPSPADVERVLSFKHLPDHPRLRANADAIRAVARHDTSLIPVSMVIGPFSLATKLIADPITPVFLAGAGTSASDDEEVRRLELVLEMALHTVLQSVRAQIAAGAKAIVVCEPAANKVYFSPNQLAAGADIFESYVMRPNRTIAAAIREGGADLIFHCCGELIDSMVRNFATLKPAMLSLGSSRELWEDAAIVPKQIVLYGNLPSKKFYSDELISVGDVQQMSLELIDRMQSINHPFILGSECDVLSVPGAEATIRQKVSAMIHCCG